MKTLWYILDENKNPVPAKNQFDAERLLLDDSKRRVALDNIVVEDYSITITVSTVFLVLNHNHSLKGKPILFESMIFNGELNQSMNRYCTWKEAEEGHQKMVELVKNNLWVSRILDSVSIKNSNIKSITKKIIEGLHQELYYN